MQHRALSEDDRGSRDFDRTADVAVAALRYVVRGTLADRVLLIDALAKLDLATLTRIEAARHNEGW